MSKKLFIAASIISISLVLTACSEAPAQKAASQQLQPIDVAEVLVEPVQNWHVILAV